MKRIEFIELCHDTGVLKPFVYPNKYGNYLNEAIDRVVEVLKSLHSVYGWLKENEPEIAALLAKMPMVETFRRSKDKGWTIIGDFGIHNELTYRLSPDFEFETEECGYVDCDIFLRDGFLQFRRHQIEGGGGFWNVASALSDKDFICFVYANPRDPSQPILSIHPRRVQQGDGKTQHVEPAEYPIAVRFAKGEK